MQVLFRSFQYWNAKNGLVLSNTRVLVSGTWSILFPELVKSCKMITFRESTVCQMYFTWRPTLGKSRGKEGHLGSQWCENIWRPNTKWWYIPNNLNAGQGNKNSFRRYCKKSIRPIMIIVVPSAWSDNAIESRRVKESAPASLKHRYDHHLIIQNRFVFFQKPIFYLPVVHRCCILICSNNYIWVAIAIHIQSATDWIPKWCYTRNDWFTSQSL